MQLFCFQSAFIGVHRRSSAAISLTGGCAPCLENLAKPGAAGGPASLGRSRGGDRPEIELVAAHFDYLVRLPVAHVVIMGYHAGARLEVPQELRPKLQVDPGPQKQGHHRGFVDVRLEQILVAELNQSRDSLLPGVRHGLLDALRVDIDAHRNRVTTVASWMSDWNRSSLRN